MTSTIITKNSSTASSVPLAADLTQGELAVNVTDKKLYSKDSGGSVVKLVGSLGNQEANAAAITGGTINGTVIGGTTAAAVSATTLTTSSTVTLNGGTANGVTYLNGSKVLTSGSALTFDGTTFALTGGLISASKGSANGITIGDVSTNSNSVLRMQGTSAGYNFQLANNLNVGGFELTPSTATGGVTYTTPVYSVTGLGVHAWSAGGSEQMRLTSTGLGIGTSSPATKLHVYGVNVVGTFQSSGSNVFSGFTTTGGSVYVGARGNAMTFDTGGTETMRLDSAGNLGLGVTPTNNTLGKTLQVGQAGAWVAESGTNRWWIGNNWYYNASDKYINNGYATLYSQQNGQHLWYNAASGTAGNAISFTQAMTLDANGCFLVGKTSSDANNWNLQTYATSGYRAGLQLTYGGVGAAGIWENSSGALCFGNDGSSGTTERARIDSLGNLLVGTTTTTSSGVGPLSLNKATNPGYVISYNGTEKAYQYMPSSTRYRGETVSGVAIEFSAGNSNGVSLASGGTSWGSLSDERKKDIIEPITNAASKVASLRSVIGKYKTDDEGTRRSFLIAQDVQAVLPEAVAENSDGDLILQYTETIPLLVAAIQELKAELDAYKASHP